MAGIYKAYDIRGIYPSDLNEETAYKIGRAFARLTGCKNCVIGRDMRLSSKNIFDALAKGITDSGADVIDIGLCSTDMVYFAVGCYGYEGGIMITASHNPPEWNGMKFMKKNAVALSGETGIFEIEKLVKENKFIDSDKKGSIAKKDIMEDFVKKVLSFVDSNKIRNLKIAVDAGNGMAGMIVPKVFEKLNCGIIPLYFELDGSFPNHVPSPIESKNLADLQKTVIEKKADFGMAFDGDADRVFFIDEKGDLINSSVITALVAKKLLEKHPNSVILHNIVTGRIVPETIEANKGKAVIVPVGHSIIKNLMREKNAIFAGEHSGHYYFRDNYYADSGIIAALIITQMISDKEKSASEILKPYRKYFAVEEINSEVEDKQAKIEEIKKKYRHGALRVLDFDGIRIDYDDWWFNVRASNTEPLLRLNLEAKSKELMEEKKDELLNIIRGE
ncbi:phosphomannomutase/phosphoglucomutase [Candidatus Woesearchaeota archaeon]|nr:phosphomannomutase/phosphoglucomutase [Candidatus Woesearchaeota archaeon]